MEKYPKLINQLDNSVITINNTMFCIGRSLTCDHIIQSLDVSRFHCIIKKSNDKWILCDRSTNGTTVNSKLYSFNNSTNLKDGDVIKLGSSNMSFIFKTSQENKQTEEDTTNKAPRSSCSALFPDDEVLIEEAASLIAEGIEEAHKEQQALTKSPIGSTENAEIKDKTRLKESQEPSSSTSTEKQPIDVGNKRVNEQKYDIADDELTCSICSELFIKAVTLNCSHTFCKHCIETWKTNQSKCPICRAKITNISPTIVLDNFIEKITNTQSDEVKEIRKLIIKQREELSVNAASSSSAITRTENVTIYEIDDDDDDDSSDMSYVDSDDYEYNEYVASRARRHRGYGGYGKCYICDEPGHWANSCPYKLV